MTGKVLVDDQPAEGATVVLHLIDGPPDALKPAGTVDSQGAFKLNTYPHGAGAPVGEYAVLVTWFEKPKNEGAEGKSRLPMRYADAKASGLHASIKEGTNTLEPYRLTKK